MRKLSTTEQNATHRIFNHVDSIVNYYGHKTLDQAIGYVSENRWIMFPVRGINSLREGAELPLLNVYVSMNGEDIIDDGNGRPTGYAGLTFHNAGSMDQLKGILKRPKTKGSKLIQVIHSLDDTWELGSVHKIKSEVHNSTPHYDPQPFFIPSVATIDAIKNSIIISDLNLPALGDIYYKTGNPVQSRITIFSIEKETDPDTFDDDIKEIFDVFMKVHTLR